MRQAAAVLVFVMFLASKAHAADHDWYVGDERCPPPGDNGMYSAPYNALEHPGEYPAFPGADKPGWSCSYKKEDGVIVQYGDSRTPQQQWLDMYAGAGNIDN